MSHPLFDSRAFLFAFAQGGAAAERATGGLLRHYRPLLRAMWRLVGVEAREWDDLSSEVLFKAVTQAHQVRAPEAFHSWLMTIAQRELAAHWSRTARERAVFAAPRLDAADEALHLLAQLPEASVHDPLLARCLQGQLAQFKRDAAPHYACIELLALGHDAPEIAPMIGRSYGSTREFISQCCAALMTVLRPCLDGGRTANWAPKRGAAKTSSGSVA